MSRSDAAGGRVGQDEVLLLWRALRRFREGKAPACAPRGPRAESECPLVGGCDRWSGPDDLLLSLDEDPEETRRRRASWPCSRLLDLLGPDVRTIGTS